MGKVAEWITAIATAITSAGLFLLWYQVKADHERSRRENAIKYLFEWSSGLTQRNTLARKIAENLNETEARDLVNYKPLKLPLDKENWLLGCLPNVSASGLKKNGGHIELNEAQVAEIRWQVVHYLNLLESVFAAARHNVADWDMLIEQFGYLVSEKEGYKVLGNVRAALGGDDAYPAIAEMQRRIVEKRQPKAGKGALFAARSS